jgi:hypothetical protein
MGLFARSFVLVALLAAASLLGVGCGETVIDDAKTEAALEENLRRSVRQDVSSVDCPSDVEVETDATFACTVRLKGGEEQTATLKILNEDADVEVTKLKPAKGQPDG